jgi:hypothetical protein
MEIEFNTTSLIPINIRLSERDLKSKKRISYLEKIHVERKIKELISEDYLSDEINEEIRDKVKYEMMEELKSFREGRDLFD